MRATTEQLLQAALDYHEKGFNVVPLLPGEKRPLGSWKRWMTFRQSEQDIQELFGSGSAGGIGIVCGTVSGNLVVRDFDQSQRFEELVEHDSRFAALMSTLPLVRTARGYHAYFRIGTPRTTRPFADGELRGNGSYVVAPPSEIGGHRYAWERPLSFLHTIDDAQVDLVTAEPHSVGRHASSNEEAQRVSALSGNIPKGLRSDREFGHVLHLVGRGFTDRDIHDHFEENAQPGTKYAEKGRTRSKWLQGNIDNARTKYRSSRSIVDAELDRFSSNIADSGVTGTERQVLRAVLEIARRAGKTRQVGISARELAEVSGFSATTCSRHLRASKLVVRRSIASGGDSATYDLDLSCESRSPLQVIGPKPTDVFCPGGLPHEVWTVYLSFTEHKGLPRSIREIQRSTHLSERTVRKHLKTLEEYRVIERDQSSRPHLWTLHELISQDRWNEIAVALGTDGSTYKKRARHEQQRDSFAWHLRARREV